MFAWVACGCTAVLVASGLVAEGGIGADGRMFLVVAKKSDLLGESGGKDVAHRMVKFV